MKKMSESNYKSSIIYQSNNKIYLKTAKEPKLLLNFGIKGLEKEQLDEQMNSTKYSFIAIHNNSTQSVKIDHGVFDSADRLNHILEPLGLAFYGNDRECKRLKRFFYYYNFKEPTKSKQAYTTKNRTPERLQDIAYLDDLKNARFGREWEEVALKWHVSYETVRKDRIKIGEISPTKEERMEYKAKSKRINNPRYVKDLKSDISHDNLAHKYGVSRETISIDKKKLKGE